MGRTGTQWNVGDTPGGGPSGRPDGGLCGGGHRAGPGLRSWLWPWPWSWAGAGRLTPERVAPAVLCGFILLVTVLRAYFHFTSLIDADEFQSLHSAWLVATGRVPYRDFIGMHTPLLWYLLAPLAGALGERPALCLTLARSVGFAMSLGLVWFSFALARRYWGLCAGFWAAAAASCWPVLAVGMAQVTTVVPMTLFTLAALYALAREPAGAAPRRGAVILAGALAALAFLSKQSPAAPGVVALFLFAGTLTRDGTLGGALAVRAAWLGLGFLAVLAPVAAALWLFGALPGFIRYVFLWHFSQWFPLSPARQLLGAVLLAPVQALAVVGGLVPALWGSTRDPAGRWGLPLAFCGFLASFCALLRPSYTHLVPVLALGSVFAGHGLDRAWRGVVAGLGRPAAGVLGTLALTAMVVALAGGLGGVRGDDTQLQRAVFVQSITTPESPVLAGYPVAFARPHAHRHWFTPPVSLMFYRELEHLPGSLVREQAPVVVWDALLQGLVDRPPADTMRAHGLDPAVDPGPAALAEISVAQEALRRFVADHYVPAAVPGVLVAGVARGPADLPGGEGAIGLVAGGEYRLQIEGDARVALDGREAGETVHLDPGEHQVRITGEWRALRLTYVGP